MSLRAVKAGDTPAAEPDVTKPAASRRRAKSVLEAANSGDMRALLIAMRSRIARAVQNPKTSPRDLAALTRQLQDIAKQIEEIDLLAKAQEDESDDEVPDEDFDPSAL